MAYFSIANKPSRARSAIKPSGWCLTVYTLNTDEARRIQRRVNTLLRDRDAIIQMLDQADYERLSRDVGRQNVAIERLEALLSGENV